MATRDPRRQAERPAIVGRLREQGRLRTILDDATTGRGALVLVSGEAGIGKTTLVDDLIQQAEQTGLPRPDRRLLRPDDDASVWPLVRSAPRLRATGGSATRPRPGSGTPDAMARVGSQTALFEETRRFFAAIAEQQPLVIVLEDLHWADAASLEALRYLARTLDETAILLDRRPTGMMSSPGGTSSINCCLC